MDCQSRDLWTNLGRITSIGLSVCKIYMYRCTVRGRLFDRGGGRRGWVLPYITHTLYMYVASQWVWFLCCFGLKMGIHCRLCPFWSGIGFGSQGKYGNV